jgi:hypothetical protein
MRQKMMSVEQLYQEVIRRFRDELKDRTEEVAHFKNQLGYYKTAAWGFLATSVGLLIVLGIAIFR